MAEHQRESDQVEQRRANFDALRNLGVEQYPRSFERTHTVTALAHAYGQRTGDELTAERIETRTAGRILAIRSFGKANFLVISDGVSKIQVYLRQDSLSERDFAIYYTLSLHDALPISILPAFVSDTCRKN